MLVEERPYGRPVGAGREKQSMGVRRTRTRAVVGVAPAVPSVIHRLDGPVERPGQPFAALADGRGISQGHQDLHGCTEAVHVAGKSRKLVCGGGSEPEKALTLSPNCTAINVGSAHRKNSIIAILGGITSLMRFTSP